VGPKKKVSRLACDDDLERGIAQRRGEAYDMGQKEELEKENSTLGAERRKEVEGLSNGDEMRYNVGEP